ncbi:MAG TPA: ribonuclease HI family protein [Thermomicrobiales bacterium]|nr:ribonuclease HI family protein [Thermomicrobiales bacterium]
MTAAFEELSRAISEGQGWTVSSDRPAAPRAGAPADARTDILLVFDGGSRGNPGQGYGSFAYKGRVVRWPTAVSYPGLTTNNQAEYQSLIAGLRAVLFDCAALGLDPADLSIEVRTDSQLVVNQLNGRWKIKNAQLRELHDAARELLQHFKRWRLAWHPRTESVRILGH